MMNLTQILNGSRREGVCCFFWQAGSFFTAIDDPHESIHDATIESTMDGPIDDIGCICCFIWQAGHLFSCLQRKTSIDGLHDGIIAGTLDSTSDGTIDKIIDGTLDSTSDSTIDKIIYGPIDGTIDSIIEGTFDSTINGSIDGVIYGPIDGTHEESLCGILHFNLTVTTSSVAQLHLPKVHIFPSSPTLQDNTLNSGLQDVF